MPLQKGDFVLIEYEVRTKDTGQLIDTTDAELAKKEGIYDEDRVYGPILVVIGEGKLLPGIEEALEGMEVGEEKTVEIPPEKAYGPYDPKKVRIVSLGVFRRQGVIPKPGDVIEVNGRTARVLSVSGGRVKLDFNHPLAGKTLIAKIKVVAKLTDDAEKLKYLTARRLRVNPEDVEVEAEKDQGLVRIRLATRAALRATPSAKLVLLDEIRRYFDWAKRVEFIETYEFRQRGERQEQEKQEASATQ